MWVVYDIIPLSYMFYIFYLSRQLHQNSFLLVKIFPGTNSKVINKKFLLVLRKLRITSSTRNENKCLPRNKNVSTINCFRWEEHLSLRYGHVIQVSGNPNLQLFNLVPRVFWLLFSGATVWIREGQLLIANHDMDVEGMLL